MIWSPTFGMSLSELPFAARRQRDPEARYRTMTANPCGIVTDHVLPLRATAYLPVLNAGSPSTEPDGRTK